MAYANFLLENRCGIGWTLVWPALILVVKMSMGSLKLLWPTVVRLVGVVSGVNWTLVKVKLAIFRSCAYDM